MNYKKLLFIFIFFIIICINVNAQNTIYSIDVNVYIDKEANASIEEKWHVKGSDGTEWYKPLRDLGKSELSNFTVSMDGNPLQKKNWNVNESLNQKRGYYGINYSGSDTELCFGKYDFNEHTFILKYNLSNYVFNTSDSQVLYWTYFSKFQNVDFQKMSVTISSYYEFPDTLDVWGYGYKGYAYVSDGKIYLSNEENTTMNGNYAVALVKFPSETFMTNNSVSYFNSFEDVYKTAQEGTFKYDYSNYYNNNYNNSGNQSIISKIFNRFTDLFELFFFGIIFIGIGKGAKGILENRYGYRDNKEIDKKNTPAFRDIPCNKDIYYANALIYLNNFGFNETNILGAIILKWVKQEKVKFLKKESKFLKKEQGCIDLTLKPTFTDKNEQRLFDIMYTASEDGILEPNEFQKWAKKHYSKFFDVFKDFKDDEINKLKTEQHIYPRTSKEECKRKNVMDDTIYEDSKRLLGLKKFLQKFTSIDTKETLEVHIWDEYLMFAYLFGMADKVAKQIKNLYPDLMEQSNIDFDTIIIINSISTSTVNAASAARRAAESYSSGGGGFSSGGGGGGSFGGGGFSGGGSR